MGQEIAAGIEPLFHTRIMRYKFTGITGLVAVDIPQNRVKAKIVPTGKIQQSLNERFWRRLSQSGETY